MITSDKDNYRKYTHLSSIYHRKFGNYEVNPSAAMARVSADRTPQAIRIESLDEVSRATLTGLRKLRVLTVVATDPDMAQASRAAPSCEIRRGRGDQ